MTLKSDIYGTMPDDRKITLFELENANGIKVSLINYGATVVSIETPDRNGNIADIAQGFDDLESWTKRNDPYFGATIGRCANRIGKGRFTLDGVEYQLAINNGPNSLHGGLTGFDKKVWDAEVLPSTQHPAVKFTLISPDGEENYPGTLTCSVTYKLTDDNKLIMEYTAETDKPTIANFTNHTYFNLGGHDSGSIQDHEIEIRANYYTPTDDDILVTGVIDPVDGLLVDLRKPVRIGSRIDEVGGFDHNYVLNKERDTNLGVARVKDPATGRTLEVFTTEPGLQFYSANFLNGIQGKGGTKYENQTSFCLEAQRFSDAINHDNFPNPVLRPGEKYSQITTYRFGVE
jgi:aldose 1-epimerase